MFDSKRIAVVIPAAGVGKRFSGEVRKQHVLLDGKPLLAHTLLIFQSLGWFDEIVLVVGRDEIDKTRESIVQRYNLNKVSQIIAGGKERQDSVYMGITAINNADYVLVHDAARPFVKRVHLENLLKTCLEFESAILVTPVKETIKKASGRAIESTVDRSVLWHAQTPQIFSKEILIKAFESAYQDGFYGTDESMLVERIGKRVMLVEGDAENIKITTKDDLSFAEFLISRNKL